MYEYANVYLFWHIVRIINCNKYKFMSPLKCLLHTSIIMMCAFTYYFRPLKPLPIIIIIVPKKGVEDVFFLRGGDLTLLGPYSNPVGLLHITPHNFFSGFNFIEDVKDIILLAFKTTNPLITQTLTLGFNCSS